MAVLKAKLLLSKELKDKWDAAKLRDDEDAAGGVAETTPGVADAIPAETQPEVEAPSTAKLPDDEDAAGGASDVEAAQGAFMAALKPALSVKKKKEGHHQSGEDPGSRSPGPHKGGNRPRGRRIVARHGPVAPTHASCMVQRKKYEEKAGPPERCGRLEGHHGTQSRPRRFQARTLA